MRPGMPRSLGAVSVGLENYQRIAEQSMGTLRAQQNPSKINGPAEVMEILELAS